MVYLLDMLTKAVVPELKSKESGVPELVSDNSNEQNPSSCLIQILKKYRHCATIYVSLYSTYHVILVSNHDVVVIERFNLSC